MPRTGTVRSDPEEPAHRRAVHRLAALAGPVIGALLLAACGGEQVIGNDVAGPATAPTTTTTTVPETTTTTIDFDRPVTQADTPLDAEAEPGDVADLVADIRGQSADIDAQVRRLAPFPDLAGPPVAQIMDIAVSLAPERDDGHPSAARVRYRIPDAGADASRALGNELRSLGWFKADEATTTGPAGATWDMVFRVPGRMAEDLELRALVEESPGVTVIDLEYVVVATDEEVHPTESEGATYLERLTAWSDDLPLPRAAALVEVGIETAPEEGTLAARFELPADDEAEAVAAVVRSIGSRGYRLRGGAPDEPPATGPLDLVHDETGVGAVLTFAPAAEAGTFEVEAAVAFPLTPLD